MLSAKRDADALIDARSKKTMTMAPIEQAVIATPAITPAFCASVGSGFGTFVSSATTTTN